MKITNRRNPGAGPACLILLALLLLALTAVSARAAEPGKWSGVDEAVIEKFAKEHGRTAKEPLIDTEQGDLMLFLFLLAGAVGGFAGGYYWRVLLEGRKHGQGERGGEEMPGRRARAEKRE